MFPSLHPSLENQMKQIKKTPNQEQKMGRSFLFDFEKEDFVLEDGKVVKIEDTKALSVWIDKILRTEKFKFKIYEREDDKEYGVTIKELVMGKKLPIQFMMAEIQREVREALLKNPMIGSIGNFNVSKVKNTLSISFKVILKDERVFDKEVIL